MIKRYDIKFGDFCDNCGCSSDAWYEENEKGIFVKYTDVKHLLEESGNKADFKFPSLWDVTKEISYTNMLPVQIKSVYNAIKKLSNKHELCKKWKDGKCIYWLNPTCKGDVNFCMDK